MLLFVLDRATDFSSLGCLAVANANVIAISAEANTSIPADFPTERVTALSSLISAEDLACEVMTRVSYIWPAIASQENCPYYKAKQLLDTIIEKQIIVERLARLPGEKLYISMPRQWVSADGDNPESCRLAALFMDALPGFTAAGFDSQSMLRERLYRVGRLALRTLRAIRYGSVFGRWRTGEALLGVADYGAENDFSGANTRKLDIGSVILSTLVRGHLIDALNLLFHDAPIRIAPPPAERWHFYLTVCRKVIVRANCVQRATDRLLAKSPEKPAYYFAVNYGRLGDIAIVRSLRRHGIPCISMQHACVGHDKWTASQYLDFWESDAKLVANDTVADSLASFEEVRSGCTYLPISLPMYRRRGGRPTWDARSLLYVLTGFTRANTMYDNRRINDALYFEAVTSDLYLMAQRFDTRIRSHPYDVRQYDDAIARHITSRLGCKAAGVNDPFAAQALVIIDSPSTILADMVLSGRPVVLINRTARLMPRFVDLASRHNVLFATIDEALEHLTNTSVPSIMLSQQAFAKDFIEAYCMPSNEVTIPQGIEAYLSSRSDSPPVRGIMCAR
jgi:hypothetical protein